MIDLSTININTLMLASVIILTLLLLIIIIQALKLKKLNNRFNNFIKRNSLNYNIEEATIKTLQEIKACNSAINTTNNKLDDELTNIKENLALVQDNLTNCIQKTGVVRYNPFDSVGGELCFALALLDKKNDGFVLNTIFTENGCYTYSKTIKNGQSTINLSSEEEDAIALAKNSTNF